jgi:molybdopterin molybdotransferase
VTAAAPELLSVEDAREAVLAAVGGAVDAEWCAVEAALGRVLADPVRALVTLPPWDNSAMDGYALRAADAATAGEAAPARLAVIGEVAAGGAPDMAVRAGATVRIATGAPIPPGADAVVPVEETTPLDGEDGPGARGRDATGPLPATVLVHAPVAAGQHVRMKGSDLAEGDEILAAGTGLTPAAIALAAGAGLARLPVRRRPRVAVLATGNEVRPPGSDLGLAGIPDANGPGLRALVSASGAEAVDLGIAPDDLDAVIERLRAAVGAQVDAIVVAGGVSVGPYDVVKLAFEAVGEIGLWRVAVQPGKPFAFGRATGTRPALLFGLPGNPVSSFVTFELFVRPALRALAGHQRLLRPVDRAVLLDDARKAAGRRAFLRVTAERAADGSVTRDAAGRALVHLSRGPAGQGSHVLSALAAADALAIVPETVDRHRGGDPVELWWLDRD